MQIRRHNRSHLCAIKLTTTLGPAPAQRLCGLSSTGLKEGEAQLLVIRPKPGGAPALTGLVSGHTWERRLLVAGPSLAPLWFEKPRGLLMVGQATVAFVAQALLSPRGLPSGIDTEP